MEVELDALVLRDALHHVGVDADVDDHGQPVQLAAQLGALTGEPGTPRGQDQAQDTSLIVRTLIRTYEQE